MWRNLGPASRAVARALMFTASSMGAAGQGSGWMGVPGAAGRWFATQPGAAGEEAAGVCAAATAAGRAHDGGARPALTHRKRASVPRRAGHRVGTALQCCCCRRPCRRRRAAPRGRAPGCLRKAACCPPPTPSTQMMARRPPTSAAGLWRVVRGKHCRPLGPGKARPPGPCVSTCKGACEQQAHAAQHGARRTAHLRVRWLPLQVADCVCAWSASAASPRDREKNVAGLDIFLVFLFGCGTATRRRGRGAVVVHANLKSSRSAQPGRKDGADMRPCRWWWQQLAPGTGRKT